MTVPDRELKGKSLADHSGGTAWASPPQAGHPTSLHLSNSYKEHSVQVNLSTLAESLSMFENHRAHEHCMACSYFSTKNLPMASWSIPVEKNVFTASRGVQTRGSPPALNDVLSSKGMPLIS